MHFSHFTLLGFAAFVAAETASTDTSSKVSTKYVITPRPVSIIPPISIGSTIVSANATIPGTPNTIQTTIAPSVTTTVVPTTASSDTGIPDTTVNPGGLISGASIVSSTITNVITSTGPVSTIAPAVGNGNGTIAGGSGAVSTGAVSSTPVTAGGIKGVELRLLSAFVAGVAALLTF